MRELVGTAIDAGVTVFDHASIYGEQMHGCEARWGEALTLSPSEREAIVIQSKVGLNPQKTSMTFDFSREHILESVDGSLAALKTDYLDMLLLHRPDALVEPDEVAAAFDELHANGKVRNFGVSNQTPGQVELLKKSVKQPLAVNQVQLSVTHAPLVAAGIAANMEGLDQSIDRGYGILDYSRLNDITLQAWSPFQKKFFNGPFIGDPEYAELNVALEELAAKYEVVPAEHRGGVDHAASREHAGGHGHDQARARARGGRRLRHPADARGVVPAVHRRGVPAALMPKVFE